MNNNTDLKEVTEALDQSYQFLVGMFSNLCAAIVAPFRELYRAEGSPYGDTDEGFLRWLKILNRR